MCSQTLAERLLGQAPHCTNLVIVDYSQNSPWQIGVWFQAVEKSKHGQLGNHSSPQIFSKILGESMFSMNVLSGGNFQIHLGRDMTSYLGLFGNEWGCVGRHFSPWQNATEFEIVNGQVKPLQINYYCNTPHTCKTTSNICMPHTVNSQSRSVYAPINNNNTPLITIMQLTIQVIVVGLVRQHTLIGLSQIGR